MVVTAPIGRDRLLGVVDITFPRSVIDEMICGGVGSLGETSPAFLINSEGLVLTNTRQEPFDRSSALQENIESEEVSILA